MIKLIFIVLLAAWKKTKSGHLTHYGRNMYLEYWELSSKWYGVLIYKMYIKTFTQANDQLINITNTLLTWFVTYSVLET